jgi:hypothetical protein
VRVVLDTDVMVAAIGSGSSSSIFLHHIPYMTKKMLHESEPLFGSGTVPSEIVSTGGVDTVNRIVDRLRARRVARIEYPERGSGFRISNMIRVYC